MPKCDTMPCYVSILVRVRFYSDFIQNFFLIPPRNMLAEVWGSALGSWERQQESEWEREPRVSFEEMKRCSEAVAEMVTLELGLGLKRKAGEGVRGYPELLGLGAEVFWRQSDW